MANNEIGNTDDRHNRSEAENNRKLRKQISNFTRKLIYDASDRRWISREDHKNVEQEITETRRLLRTALALRDDNSKLEENGINPKKFWKEIDKVIRSSYEVRKQAVKLVTSKDTTELIEKWKGDRETLSEWVEKLTKDQGPNQVKENTAIAESSRERIEDTREIEQGQLQLVDKPTFSGWRGSASQTLESLLQKVLELAMSHSEVNELKEDLYELYAINNQQQGFSSQTDEINYQKSLFGINSPQGVTEELTGEEKFLNFSNDHAAETEDSYRRRIILNIHPDHIVNITSEIVQKISNLSYISEIKVTYDPVEVVERLDNLVIYFSDPPRSANKGAFPPRSANKDALAKLLLPYAQYTRSTHPAMMEPMKDSFGNSIEGIAFADQSKGDSFGDTRIRAIAQAAWNLKDKGDITFDTLLPEVKRQFKEHGIDPDAPQWDTH